MWWLKARQPHKYRDFVCVAGEFHGLAHLVDGLVILNWSSIYSPILLHFGVVETACSTQVVCMALRSSCCSRSNGDSQQSL